MATSEAALRRTRFRVTGRVQGVFFRASTRDAARQVGATGWVRNLPDGAVDGEVQGADAAVEAVLAFLAEGPRHARVLQVQHDDVAPEPGETGFVIR